MTKGKISPRLEKFLRAEKLKKRVTPVKQLSELIDWNTNA